MDSLYGGEEVTEQPGRPVETCSARERCEVFRATRMFGPGGLAEEDCSSTMPDDGSSTPCKLSTFVAKRTSPFVSCAPHWSTSNSESITAAIITKVHDEAASAQRVRSPTRSVPSLRSHPARQGEVLRELVRIDPALEAHPQIDRRPAAARSPSNDSMVTFPATTGLSLEAARRRAFFEWPEAEISKTARPATGYALDLARGTSLARVPGSRYGR